MNMKMKPTKSLKESIDRFFEFFVLPAYDMVMRCSHIFNIIDARGAISVTERAYYIQRVRNLAKAVAKAYVKSREKLGFPLLKK